jgi:2-polyprenyl-3-methyl-5-hydroxy-6-metoxy-1,4-benzoquinol methylase
MNGKSPRGTKQAAVRVLTRALRGRHTRIPAAQWDREFAAGEWERLWEVSESGHHFLVAGLLSALKPTSILDVGCGEGTLKTHIGHVGYEQYLGIDLSQTAVEIARTRDDDSRAEYLQADAATWVPPRHFDVVLFVESLYYLTRRAETIRRYTAASHASHVVVSAFRGIGSRVLWLELGELGTALHKFTVRNARGQTWDVACFAVAQ